MPGIPGMPGARKARKVAAKKGKQAKGGQGKRSRNPAQQRARTPQPGRVAGGGPNGLPGGLPPGAGPAGLPQFPTDGSLPDLTQAQVPQEVTPRRRRAAPAPARRTAAGGRERDLWVRDGGSPSTRCRARRPLPGRRFVLPGLVDAHCHIGLAPAGITHDPDQQLAAGAGRT